MRRPRLLELRENRFDLIIMPTHAGIFREMLLGSTTAKVINDADCPVLTSRHAQIIAPRPLEHREWLCAIGLSSNSERVLRYASQVAAQARGKLSIIHAVQAGDTDRPIQLDLREEIHSAERREARRRIADLQLMVPMFRSVLQLVQSKRRCLRPLWSRMPTRS